MQIVFLEDDASVPVENFLTSLSVNCQGPPTISSLLQAIFLPRFTSSTNLGLTQLHDRFYARLPGAYAVGSARVWSAADTGGLAALSRPERGFTNLGYLREAWASVTTIMPAMEGQSAIESICRVSGASTLTTYILHIYAVRDGPSVSHLSSFVRPCRR